MLISSFKNEEYDIVEPDPLTLAMIKLYSVKVSLAILILPPF